MISQLKTKSQLTRGQGLMARPDAFNPGTWEAEAGRSGTHEAYLDSCSIVCALFEQVASSASGGRNCATGLASALIPHHRHPGAQGEALSEREVLFSAAEQTSKKKF